MFASKTLWETFLWWSIFRAEILGGHYTLLLALSGFKSCFLFYILTYFFTIKRLLNIYFPNCSCPLQNETWRLYQRLKQSPVSKCSYSIPASLADSKCLFSLIMFKALKPTPQAHAPHPTRSASRSIIVTRNAMVARVPAHSRQTCWKQTQMTTLIENSDWKSRLLGSSLCLSDCSCSLLLPGEKKKNQEKGKKAGKQRSQALEEPSERVMWSLISHAHQHFILEKYLTASHYTAYSCLQRAWLHGGMGYSLAVKASLAKKRGSPMTFVRCVSMGREVKNARKAAWAAQKSSYNSTHRFKEWLGWEGILRII